MRFLSLKIEGHFYQKRLDFEQSIYLTIIAFDEQQAKLARIAWRQYGKGRHPAKLNFGDCCSYALAKYLNQPLLFKGDDFSKTDLTQA
ncbi:MAG: type II toxin-antitoxin system VapC family toxin [Methylococcales bacterium]